MAISPLLAVEDVTKRYAGVPVLRDVSWRASSGEIVAIVGENGAGKSTLMRILAGAIPAGEYNGTIRIDGAKARFITTRDAERSGVVMIPQELATVSQMTVAENLFRNREPGRFGIVDTARLRGQARRVLAEFGLDVDPDASMGRLGIARQQLVEIAKALSKRARILILDEPTASLTLTEAERLFVRLRDLREAGYLCLYISHRLDEVLGLADRILVLRDGVLAGELPGAEATNDAIVRLMLGRPTSDVFPDRRSSSPGAEIISVDHLSVEDPAIPGRRLVDDVSLSVRAGEIVGLFGLVGAGRTELAMTLFGNPPGKVTGSIHVSGASVTLRSPREAIAAGVALVTEDRKRYGYVPDLGIRQNLTLAALGSVCRAGILDPTKERSVARKLVNRLGIRAASADVPARALSGGNQQKVVLGKWLVVQPLLLILDEPTRGVDVGAKAEIYRQILELADAGLAVLVISTEVPEVLGMADRVLVMFRGRITGEVGHGTADDATLLALATGGSRHAA